MMSEPYVQVPVSLLVDLLTAPEDSPAYAQAVSFAARTVELASQQTPSAEPVTLHVAWQEGYDTGWMSRDNYGDPDDEEDYSNPYPAPTAAPPSIADMAPGLLTHQLDFTKEAAAMQSTDINTEADRPKDNITPQQMRELANALRRDAGDYARYMAGSLPVDEIGSWDMREVRAWQASEFIEAITVVPTMVTLTMNTLLTEGGHGPNSAARNEYARRLTEAISAVFDAPRLQR